MKILVTGFKPFLGQNINPSEILSKELEAIFSSVTSLILPVQFEKSFEALNLELNKNDYELVLMLGQASGRKKICLERFAMNWTETSHEDGAGVIWPTGQIVQDQPMLLQTKIDIDSLLKKNNDSNLTASTSAGNYVCNDLYYRMLLNRSNIKSIFVHLPLFEKQISKDFPFFLTQNVQSSVLKQLILDLHIV
jgi:pyroglutamyl-peptidase